MKSASGQAPDALFQHRLDILPKLGRVSFTCTGFGVHVQRYFALCGRSSATATQEMRDVFDDCDRSAVIKNGKPVGIQRVADVTTTKCSA